MTVGVLALQGDFDAHRRALAEVGAESRRVVAPEHLDGLAALVMPGGESTTMLKLIESERLRGPLEDFCRSGRPVLGTCAGAILLAREVTSPAQPSLGVLDATAERNAYGRQIDSFVGAADDDSDPAFAGMELVFIRAPILRDVGPEVSVLARCDGHPALVRQGPVWAATFHPELTDDRRVYEKVLEDARR